MALHLQLPETAEYVTVPTAERPTLKAPEIPLSADLNISLNHPDEALASFDPTQQTKLQEQIAACHLTDEERQALRNQFDVELVLRNKTVVIPRVEMYEEILTARRESLLADREKQTVRITHLQNQRANLLKYAVPGKPEIIAKAKEDPTVYMSELVQALGQMYVERSIQQHDVRSGLVMQRFGLLPEKTLSRSFPGVDMDVAVAVIPETDEVAAFRISSDLQGKLTHVHSLVLNSSSPTNAETGKPEFQVLKHGWKKGARVEFEVTDETEKMALFQAFVTNFYHGVSSYDETDDEATQHFIRRSQQL